LEEIPLRTALNTGGGFKRKSLVAGAEEFVRHGEVSVLRDYFRAREKSPALERLLAAMNGFAEELTLCHYGELRTAIVELRRRIEAFSDESSASISAEAV